MNTAVVKEMMEVVYGQNRAYHEAFLELPGDLREAILALSKLSKTAKESVLKFDEEYRKLKARQEQCKEFMTVRPESSAVFGMEYRWPQFWFEKLQGHSLDLRFLPYKQCHWCGRDIKKPRKKFFDSPDCAEHYRIWRDNVKRVGKGKGEAERNQYYLQKVYELFDEKKPQALVSVLNKAYQLASEIMRARLPVVLEELEKGEANYFLFYEAMRNKIIQLLLKQYAQQSSMAAEHVKELSVSPMELSELMTPAAFFKDSSRL